MPRKQYTIHYIYKITNIINNKYYIGMHSTFNLEDGYFGSGKYLWNSLKKYGKENFKKEILEFFPDRKSLVDREKELVNKELINDPLCMNLMKGGEGGWHKNIFGGREKWIKGGLKQAEINFDILCSNLKKGREICLKKIKDGTYYSKRFSGKKHSEETKERIKTANKGKGIGKQNSQYGTCWIYNIQLKKNKKIKKNDLNYWLELGWIKGRKLKMPS